MKMKKTEKKVNTAFTLSPTSLRILDEKRGREPRSSFIDRMIKECIGMME
jgi:hypothetical protein